jgi:MFS family permease
MDESIISRSGGSLETEHSLPEVLREPTSSKSPLFLVLYGVANMVIGVGNITLSSIVLPLHIDSVVSANQTTIFSLVVGIGAVAAMLTNPLAGMFSDRTTSRFGRRRSWLIAGGILTVVATLLLSLASSLLLVVLEWIFLQVAINIVQAALSALIPDQVPVRQRATVSAFAAGFGTLLGGLVGAILVAQVFRGIQAAYTSIAVAVFIMLSLFLLVLRELPLPRENVPPFRFKSLFTGFSVLNPLTYHDFFLTWLARCLVFLGYTTVVNFMFFYLQDAVGYARSFPGQTTAQGVQTYFAINVASILVGSLLGGILSDRLQRRKVFVISAGFAMTLALLLFGFFPTWTVVVAAAAVLGLGMGVFLSADLALGSQVLPTAEDRGKDIGIINTAIFLPMVLAPLLVGITVGVLHSYVLLFSLLAVGMLCSAALISRIKSVR